MRVLLTTYYLLLTTCYLLLTTYYLLLTTYYSLLTTHYSLLTRQALDFLTHSVWTTCLARKRGVPLYAFNLEEDSHGFFRRS